MAVPPRVKPHRSKWGAEIPVQAFGVRMLIRVGEATLRDDIRACLPPQSRLVEPDGTERIFSLVTPARNGGMYQLYEHDTKLAPQSSLDDALHELESRMQIYVAEMAEDRVFVHAGVVGWEGKAILLPGRSFAGKTTLVRELVRRGATYYSDEYAVLDEQGLVHPFARPLGIRTEGLRQKMHAVETLGGEAGTGPIRAGLVVFSEYLPRARWRPERLSPGQGLLELLGHTVSARRKPATALQTLERIVAEAPVIRIVRGEARCAGPRLLSLMNP